MFGQVIDERLFVQNFEETLNGFLDQKPKDPAALDRAQAERTEVVVSRAEELERSGNRVRIGSGSVFGFEFRLFVDDQFVQ